MTAISAEAAVTRQVKQEKPAKKKRSSSLQEIIHEALEADRYRTFHGFQTSIGHGGFKPYGSNPYSNGVIHNGSATWTLAGHHSSSGTLVVNAGSILGSSTSLEVAGAGTLTLSGTNTIDPSNPSSVLTFSNSSSLTWSNTLPIIGWNGSVFVANIYGSNSLSGTQLSQIQFIDPNNPSGGLYLIIVPEPSTALLGASAALLLFRRRR